MKVEDTKIAVDSEECTSLQLLSIKQKITGIKHLEYTTISGCNSS